MLINFAQGQRHYQLAKQNLASGKSYINLPKGQRKAIRRERSLDTPLSNSYMNVPKTPETMYSDTSIPSLLLQDQRMQRQTASQSDINVLKRQAQLNDNYVAPYDSPGIKSRLENSKYYKNIENNPRVSIGTLDPLENNSQFLLRNRNKMNKNMDIAETGRDYSRMSNDYKQIGHNFTPGQMPENLVEDMSQAAHIVPMYNDNLSYQGNFLRSRLGFSPTRVRKLKSGETPTSFLDIPSGRTIY